MVTECLFNENSVVVVIGGAALLALILLGIFGRKRCRCSDYIFGMWNLAAFTMHVIINGYFLYAPRLTKKMAGEQLPKADDFYGCYVTAVRNLWRDQAEIDTRMYLDEAQFGILASAYSCVYGAGTLCLLTFFGYLFGSKCTPLMQTAAAVWHLATMYFFIMPEYFDGFKHVTDLNKFIFVNAPAVIIPALALLTTLCKMCGCCSGASVCPFAPASAAAQQAEKKKKQ